MIQFNHRGFITPNANVSSSLNELNKVFVKDSESGKRNELFEKYCYYSNSLKELCKISYLQWINGSFCTLKNEPKDIDLVSFIPHWIIENDEKLFYQFSYPNAENEYGVDAYIVKTYPENHRLYPLYNGDKLYWLEQFSKTKLNRLGRRYTKGFLEITF